MGMTARARETVDMIRATLPTVTDADVFVSPGGDALIWTSSTVIHVDTNGGTSETPVTFSTGWEA